MAGKSDQVNSILDCGVCLDRYDPTVHIPVMFECQHNVCQPCLGGLIKKATENFEAHFPCPMCRNNIQIKPGGVGAYPKNRLLLELLQTEEEKKETKCPTHPTKAVSHVCFTCKVSLCCSCVVGSFKDNTHSGCHDVQEVEEAYATMDRIAEKGQKILDKFVPLRRSYRPLEANLDKQATGAKQEVKRIADKIIREVRAEQCKLLNEIDRIPQKCVYDDAIDTIQTGVEKCRRRDTSVVKEHYGLKEIESLMDALSLKGLEDYGKKLKQTIKLVPADYKIKPFASLVKK